MKPGELRTAKVMEEVAFVDASWMMSSVPVQGGKKNPKQKKTPQLMKNLG